MSFERRLLRGLMPRRIMRLLRESAYGSVRHRMESETSTQIDQQTAAGPPGNRPTFCIVTPAFNSECYIDATIGSIISQRGAFRVRYHIQDGFSRDGTLSRVKQWAAQLREGGIPIGCEGVEFSFDSSRDGGMYDAINKGFSALGLPEDTQSPGDFYMTWLNSDDCLMPGALSLSAHLFQRFERVQWLGGRPCEIDASGCITRIHEAQIYPERTLVSGLHEGNHLPFVMQEGTFWRSTLWSKVGGLNRGLRLAGDFDLWRRMATHASYLCVDTILAGHRRHPEQLSESLAGYYAEVDRLLSGAAAELRDTEWSRFQKWYARSAVARDGTYAGQVAVYSSGSREWTIEHRSFPTPLGGTVYAQDNRVVTAIPGRFVAGFGGEDHAFAHLNLPRGSSMIGQMAAVEFTVADPGPYRVFLRCRNFLEGLLLTLGRGDLSLLTVRLPATGHDRDCVVCAQTHFDGSNNGLRIELTPPSNVPEAALLVLSCEAVPMNDHAIGAWSRFWRKQ